MILILHTSFVLVLCKKFSAYVFSIRCRISTSYVTVEVTYLANLIGQNVVTVSAFPNQYIDI